LLSRASIVHAQGCVRGRKQALHWDGAEHDKGPESRNVATVGAPTRDKSRYAEHGGVAGTDWHGVRVPPGVVILAPPRVPRNAEGEPKQRPRLRRAQKARPRTV
jgi:hypothetical protein